MQIEVKTSTFNIPCSIFICSLFDILMQVFIATSPVNDFASITGFMKSV